MKKFFAALALVSLFTSCDDGDIIYEDLDFEAGEIDVCDSSNATVLYKTEGDQAFIINLPALNSGLAGDLPGQPTDPTTPLLIPITGTTRVVYRHYNGTVTGDNICASIPPATPIVDEEWVATSGNIVVSTQVNKTTYSDTDANFPGGEAISSLSHAISFQNITFNTGSGSQTYNTYPFGTYEEALTGFAPTLPSANSTLAFCPVNGYIYSVGATRLFAVKLSPQLLDPAISETKTDHIDGETNVVFFRSYPAGTALDNPLFTCTDIFTATASSQWDGVNGDETTMTGRIEVTSSTIPGSVTHSIHLRNVTLKNGNFEFLIATDYFLGEVTLAN